MIEKLHPIVDAPRIAALLAPGSPYQLVDGWDSALPELAVIDQPHLAAPTEEARRELAAYVASARRDESVEAASRYIVFPWRQTIVRLPDAEHFLRLRTARNRYLVDDEEQRLWSNGLIGVAGLSVGSSVLAVCSLTGARRFRLTERDTLGPTNLNRLTASVCDLGRPKLLLAQRRTLESDPYSEIASFPDGYSPAVADSFLCGGRNGAEPGERLAVLIEEMDDLAMKIDIRLRAKAASIPVVMVTDHGDSAFLDVERYDLEPDYLPFHGRAGDLVGLSPTDLSDPRRRIQIVSAIVGSKITPRSRYSLTQVGRTLPSWPQLGTAVTLAGALGALAARLIICGSVIQSGRYRVDLDEVLVEPGAGSSVRWNELGETEFLAAIRSA